MRQRVARVARLMIENMKGTQRQEDNGEDEDS